MRLGIFAGCQAAVLTASLTASLPAVALATDEVPGSGSAWTGSSVAYANPEPDQRMFGGVDLGVPVMLERGDGNLVRPGINLHGQGGADWGYVAAFLHGGYRFIPVDFERAAGAGHPEYAGLGRNGLTNPYFGLGLRLQLPNQTRVMPYASGSFDINFWDFHEEKLRCVDEHPWWCNDSDQLAFTPGVSGRLGVAVRGSGSFYLDLGANVSMTFAGSFFPDAQVWVEPYIGLMQRL
jgi:hypothetical protein